MKKWFLNFQINKLKKQKVFRENTTFDNAQTIGIIYNSLESFKKGKQFRENLINFNKKIDYIVRYKPKKEEKTPFKFFNLSEVSIIGNVNSKILLDFNKEKFDFLLYFGENYNSLIEYTLLKSNSKCRVGYYIEGKEYLFDLMFNKSMSELEIINKIKEIKVNG